MNERLPCQLYIITPPTIDDMDGFCAKLSHVVETVPIGCLQIRLKDADDLAIIHAADAIVPICHANGVSVVVNDRPDLVEACKADGVHIGQQDMDYFTAREIVGENSIIGVTCHDSKELAFQAATSGANYVAFGAFFETSTKQAKSHADLEILTWWNEAVEIPCVAIGGITPDNAKPVIAAGADYIALSAGLWNWPEGPQSAAQRLYQMCLDYSPQ